ncbi:elongation factor 1-beta [Candidatus Woesearchaeota archaeon]|nr:elongation factor 1-beta [Candidatus Woesearchaeota archaeon]
MANVVVTLKIMPDSPDVNLDKLEEDTQHIIKEFAGDIGRVVKEPVGFGLTALKITFVMSEDLGGTDDLEEKVKELKDVGNAEVVDVRRAVG